MALAASLLDKLIDNDPQSREDKDFPLTQQLLIDNLLRDLESMLNSRIGWREVPFELKEANKSILNYGLPDFSSMPFSSQQGQGELCGIVRAAIREFEPRLSSPVVNILQEKSAADRTLRLQINATCLIGNSERDVTFNTEVEPVNLGMKLSRAK
ncbi:type VI secretion system baseplate subunit TssE [Vibrio harveyi]|uniref:type VI secretion system baseplate subunit TssE n=1 Tax=Vibrio harveyi TaxID=669 RepID=UPI000C7AB788|nr:type VI secretion system baseplate subunit TssE [Vibrio harveyi]